MQQLDERYCLVSPVSKDATMVALLLEFSEKNPKGLIIVFTDTCKSTQVSALDIEYCFVIINKIYIPFSRSVEFT